MRILLAQGAVTVEDYLGQARASIPRTPPAADLAATFDRHLTRAHDIAERRVRNPPRDADAHFQLGAADGLRASYIATAEGRVRDSIGAARRAYAENKRSLALNPARRDAGLIVGLYQYGISSLSLPMRLLARLAGFNSGRERGLQLVEDAARFPSDAQTNARFSLVLLYNREGRFDEALAIVRELQRQYPRNRLLWLEAAGTALRAKRPDDALRDLDAGLLQLAHDPRVRGSGEEARWRALRARAEQELSRTRGARQPADEGARR
jgi:tetratricopeptide (TPR) repeat protein